MPDDERWQVVSERLLLDRAPWLRVSEQTLRLPDGRLVHGFLHAESPPYAMVLGVRKDGKVVAIEEYKHGPGAAVVLHLPAGYLEPGEEPLAAAQREFWEETGYEAHAWTYLGALYEDGNRGMSLGHYFLAQDARQVNAPDPGDLAEIRPLLLTPSELRAAIRAGCMGTAGAVACALMGLDALG